MAHYKDADGKDRHFEILLSTVERVRSALGIDLYRIDTLSDVSADPPSFARLMHFSQDTGETSDEWCRAHRGDAFERAYDAFMLALIGFFPSRLASLVRLSQQTVGQTRRMRNQALEQLSGSWQDTLALTPEASRFGSWFGWSKGPARKPRPKR